MCCDVFLAVYDNDKCSFDNELVITINIVINNDECRYGLRQLSLWITTNVVMDNDECHYG